MKPIVIGIAAAMLTSGVALAQNAQGNSVVPLNNNPAVATTSANAAKPASGSNSFTMAQAKSRIESDGFSNVTDLQKDNNGVWHGHAQKGGNTTTVWLDYKGNVGQAQ